MTEDEFLDGDDVWTGDHQPTRWGFRETRVVKKEDGSLWIGRVHVTSGDYGESVVEDGPHPAESYEDTETKWRRKP